MSIVIQPSSLQKQLIELVAVLVEPKLRGQLTPEAEILEAKLIDSFGLIQLVADIEEKLGVAVRTEDMTLENFSTISGIARLVSRYLNEARG